MSTVTLHNEKKKALIPQLRFQEFDGKWETNKLSDWKLKVIDGDRGTNYPNGDDFSVEGYCLFMNAKNVTKNGFSFETKMFITKEKDEKLRKGKLKRNDLILTTRGSVGNIAFYDDSIKFENLRINSGMVLIRNENCKIDSRFIYFSFFTPKLNRIIDTISFGSAQPQLTVKEINLFKFNIPTLPEQQKISSFLSSVDEKIQQLSRKKELLEQYKKGVTQQLFSGKLRFKDENGEDYADWEKKKLGEVSTKKSSNISANKIEDNIGEFIIYGASGILKKVDFYKEENDYISIVKDGAGVGRLFYCKGKSSVLGTMEIISPKQNIDTYFLYCLLSNIDFVKYVTGSTIPHIYFKDYSNEFCGIPSLQEQQKIAAFLSSIDTKIESTCQQINQTQSFKKGLLQQLFV